MKLLLQDVMDHFYDRRSVTDKGKLFHLCNALCQRSVTKIVSESFNYVSEFISFVTKAYIILAFALDTLGLKVIQLVFFQVVLLLIIKLICIWIEKMYMFNLNAFI